MTPEQPGRGEIMEPSNVYVELAAERAGEVINHGRFVDRAENEPDPNFAEDLRFAAQIAADFADVGLTMLAVGGFVRDTEIARQTGKPVASKDIDSEVYGIEFEALAERLKGYGRVDLTGASFVVIKLTNPESGNVLDFSIPREDSKSGPGHRGFVVTGRPDMSVREAARRRDLTINALACNPLTGELIDEYGGVQDIADGVLRATDYGLFPDDPLRVLRVARFAGQFGYQVEPRTAELCRSLNLSELPKERIGQEWNKLMVQSPKPSVGLEAMRELGVLAKLHPQLAVLDQIEQEPDWHPEGNVWNHTKLAADAAARIVREEGIDPESEDGLVVLYGALCHDLGKALTTEPNLVRGEMRLTSRKHEQMGVEPARAFFNTINLKREVSAKILAIIPRHLAHIHNKEATDEHIKRFAVKLAPANIRLWDLVSRSDANGRGGEFEQVTKSHDWYERSLRLEVAEKPEPKLITGEDLMAEFELEPSNRFKFILERLYDAQLGGRFSDRESGLRFYLMHRDSLNVGVDKDVAEAQVARQAYMAKKQEESRAKSLADKMKRQKQAG